MTTVTPALFQVGITDHITPPADIEQAGFPEAEIHFLADWRTDAAQRDLWPRMDALLVWRWPMNTATLDLAQRCRIVVRYGVGYDCIDIADLTRRNIAFSNNPDYGTAEVADTACALILALQRKILSYDRACRQFTRGWMEHVQPPLGRTSDQTLGIVGMGRIGTAVALRMRGFGYRIVGLDPYQPWGHEKAIGYERVRHLDDLLATADIVSLHCTLTPETRGMINRNRLQRMKPGASIVNTARGQLFEDLNIVEQALREGRLASAAFDALPTEPPGDQPLIRAWRNDEPWLRGRLIITPHTAFFSDQASYELRFKAAETARLFLTEDYHRNFVAPPHQ